MGWSPAALPAQVTAAQLRRGHSAASVPSTPKVLDLALRRYGSGAFSWAELVTPAAALADDGVILGPFRARAFQFYGAALADTPPGACSSIPKGVPGSPGTASASPCWPRRFGVWPRPERRTSIAALSLRPLPRTWRPMAAGSPPRISRPSPSPPSLSPLRATYRGYEIATLPPPFGGWVLLQLMKVLEQMPLEPRQQEAPRQLQLLEAMRLAHGTRARDPVSSFTNYEEDVAKKISEAEAARLWSEKGETTHFSVVDDAGWVVAVTQSIDSYFGAKVAHPTLGFLYNNYMQGFRLRTTAADA